MEGWSSKKIIVQNQIFLQQKFKQNSDKWCPLQVVPINIGIKDYSLVNNGNIFLVYVEEIYLQSRYSETLNNEYIERIHQMSYSSLSDNGML